MIQIDGENHEIHVNHKDYDRLRDEIMFYIKIKVIRFSNDDIKERIIEVKNEILEIIESLQNPSIKALERGESI